MFRQDRQESEDDLTIKKRSGETNSGEDQEIYDSLLTNIRF